MVGIDPKSAALEDEYISPAEIARPLGNHPSAPVRWMRRGVLLSDGSKLFLRHVVVPGGYRSTRQWVADFLEALTEDRRRADGVPVQTTSPKRQSARLAAAEAALASTEY
jgi:hypothetical protein